MTKTKVVHKCTPGPQCIQAASLTLARVSYDRNSLVSQERGQTDVDFLFSQVRSFPYPSIRLICVVLGSSPDTEKP